MARAERGNHLNIKVQEIGPVNVNDAARELRRDAPELVVVLDAPVVEVLGELAALAVLGYSKPNLIGRRAEKEHRLDKLGVFRHRLDSSLSAQEELC